VGYREEEAGEEEGKESEDSRDSVYVDADEGEAVWEGGSSEDVAAVGAGTGAEMALEVVAVLATLSSLLLRNAEWPVEGNVQQKQLQVLEKRVRMPRFGGSGGFGGDGGGCCEAAKVEAQAAEEVASHWAHPCCRCRCHCCRVRSSQHVEEPQLPMPATLRW